MANEPSKTPTPQPQAIPLAKIHDLPGAAISKQPDCYFREEQKYDGKNKTQR